MSDYPISIPTNLQSLLFSSKPPPPSPLFSPCSSIFRPPSLRNRKKNPKQEENKKNSFIKKPFENKPKNQKKEYLCSYCKLKFRSNFNLKRHLTLHNKSTNFSVCQNCHKQFTRKDNLNVHMRICQNSKDDICIKNNGFLCDFEGCGKRYPNTTLLNYHKKKHNEKIEVICGLAGCEEKFADEKLMKKHRKLKKLHLKKLFLKEGLGEERRERREYNKFIDKFIKAKKSLCLNK